MPPVSVPTPHAVTIVSLTEPGRVLDPAQRGSGREAVAKKENCFFIRLNGLFSDGWRVLVIIFGDYRFLFGFS